MQDEFTTEMHWGLMQSEVTREDFLVMAVHGAIKRGATKAESMKKYGLSKSTMTRLLRG